MLARPIKAATKARRPNWLRRRLARWPLLLYRSGLGFLVGRQVMVLSTTGRTTGMVRETPLWYVRQGDTVYCLSGWGRSSDWWRNVQATPNTLVRIGRRAWQTQGTRLDDPPERERLLSLFLKKYGRLGRLVFRLDEICLVAFPLTAQTLCQPHSR